MMYALLMAALLVQPPAHEGEWTVEVIDNIKVMSDTRVTLTIRNTVVSGFASCNTYTGTLTRTAGDEVRIDGLLKTMKACDGPRMSQENDFLGLLKSVIRVDVRTEQSLVLTTSTGKTITASRAKPPSDRR